MKNIITILATFIFCSCVFAQNNSRVIKKQKTVSIEQNEFQSICSSIKQIIENYDCEKFLNKKFYLKNENEELIVFIKKKQKIKLKYKSTHPENEILNLKYERILKILE